MEITIKNRVAQQLRSDIASIDVYIGNKDYGDPKINLAELTIAEATKFRDILQTSKIQGTKIVAADITKYLRAAEHGIDGITARTVRQAAWMIEHLVASLPHHAVFSEDEYEGGSHVGYFVGDVDYHPEYQSSSGNRPEFADIDLFYARNDERCKSNVSFYAHDVIGMTAKEILRKAGYLIETEFLWDKLGRETVEYYRVRDMIGTKCKARGVAACDLDDASKSGKKGWSKIRLDNFGESASVVIDVLDEEDEKRDRGRDAHVNLYRWHEWNLRFFSPAEDDLARHLEADENTDEAPVLQIPVHPMVPVFDLKRHRRISVHLNNLTQYAYRPEVASGLVIPERDRALIDMLVDQSSNTFEDVVEGKGQSMNVLSGGPPGTGKTLTAEIFAEYKRRPLYTVQCSQLGLAPDEIEENLSVILKRANRWNAILLLDEADVYIRRRGGSLEHNAIVGVFLRVLEYAQCIMFLTTNLPDEVDDAIASRCIVAVHYEMPTADAQAKIWAKLAALNSLTLAPETIAAFVASHSVSGRDIKNLLKLASFVAAKRGDRKIALDDLVFALQYKPTASVQHVAADGRRVTR